MNIFEECERLYAQLEALRPLSPDAEQKIWQKFRFDWNYHSNSIEGNSLTFGETKSLLLHNITASGKPLKDHFEITGHNEAILQLVDFVKRDEPLTESFIRQLHKLILRERYQVSAQTPDGQPTRKWVEVGQYKTLPNHVLTATGEVFRFAEPIDVAKKMGELVDDANLLQSLSVTEAIVAASNLHYEFVRIHPFDDGNGRMARILMNLVLMRFRIPPAVISTKEKVSYFAALRQADGGQLDMFAEYIANCVAHSLTIMISGAKGDSIEDADEQDKKITLLTKLLKSTNDPLDVTRSRDTLNSLIEQSFIPLTYKLQIAANKFAQLYRRIDTSINVGGHGIQSSANTLELSAFSVALADTTPHLAIAISFENLMFEGMDSRCHYWQITFDTQPVTYGLNFNGVIPVELPRSSYSRQLPTGKIELIVKAFIQAHIEFIETCSGVRLDS